MSQSPGNLFLIPTPIHENGLHSIPDLVLKRIRLLDYFIVERLRTARRFVKSAGHAKPIAQLSFQEYHKGTPDAEIPILMAPVIAGKDCGILSEAGCPCIADPGARLVEYAHNHGIPVFPLPGPSSIFLALMGSGLSGQGFTFHGYLPSKRPALRKALGILEKDVHKSGKTQIFMETPYKNHLVIECADEVLQDNTIFSIAGNVLAEDQFIYSAPMREWRRKGFPSMHKVPVIFLVGKHYA